MSGVAGPAWVWWLSWVALAVVAFAYAGGIDLTPYRVRRVWWWLAARFRRRRGP